MLEPTPDMFVPTPEAGSANYIFPRTAVRASLRLQKKTKIPFDEDRDTCWEIDSARDKDGYGRFYVKLADGSEEFRAHRVAWILAYGPIPKGLSVLHKCDNPPCVRVLHLFLGTPGHNMIDRKRKLRHSFGSTHPRSKLTEAQIVDIRAKAAGGARGIDLAREFGVSTATMGKIITRTAWRHVP